MSLIVIPWRRHRGHAFVTCRGTRTRPVLWALRWVDGFYLTAQKYVLDVTSGQRLSPWPCKVTIWRASSVFLVHNFMLRLTLAKCWVLGQVLTFNPFTPKSDQFQISPAASPEIWHHTVWRTWLFIAYSDERWFYYQFSLPHLYISLWEGWENVLFELGS